MYCIMHAMDTGIASKPNKFSIPLWLQVLLCVLIGTAIGVLLGKTSPLGPDPGRTKWLDTAGGTGMLVIQVLRALAVTRQRFRHPPAPRSEDRKKR